MSVNTHWLIAKLVADARVSAICQLGSMNGANALILSAVFLRASVYAFLPKQPSLRLMEARRGCHQRIRSRTIDD
jgi:hypothetical protein